jgi:hypothetical protein
MCNAPSLTVRRPVALAGVLLSLCALGARAGDLNAPAAPSSASSALYTLEDIYNRLSDNTLATKRTGGFTAPSAAPAATGQTLDAIYAKALPTQVPKTGQINCFNQSHVLTNCDNSDAFTGYQDGALQKGVPSPSPRFTDNGNGTVTDNRTGLIWLQNANCPNTERDWATALTDVASLNSAGTMNGNNCGDTSHAGSHQVDWRLANIKELQSLTDYAHYTPVLPSGHPFTGMNSGYYWSSTSKSIYWAWYQDFDDGYVDSELKEGYTRNVWPVRGGQ